MKTTLPPVAAQLHDERVKRAVEQYRLEIGVEVAVAAGSTDPAMIELFLIVSGYLDFGPFGSGGERAAA